MLKTAQILVVDDEAHIRNLIKEYLSIGDYVVTCAADGFDALKALESNTYDLMVLDVMMPKVDGWMVIREVRKTSRMPIILLTARGEEYDKLLGFELGVDDYLVKPFSPKELMARIKAVMTRTNYANVPNDEHSKNRLTFEGLTLERLGRTVEIDGRRLNMTPKEYELLLYLMENPRIAFSREQLLSAVWGYDFYGDDRTVDTHIKMLREHLKDKRHWLITVWGLGYKFDPSQAKG